MKLRVVAVAVLWSVAGGVALGPSPDADFGAVPPPLVKLFVAALRAQDWVGDGLKIEGKSREAWNDADRDLQQLCTTTGSPHAGRH